ncbi:MAG: Plasmid stabilization system [Candidatus Uhrbacteria bacterium GW2011_GWA2_41_10]|nr:MAG: Plasmid stabilization system [Candidatus Uhrbacteria bacterium GW2011_GWA2_41_10]
MEVSYAPSFLRSLRSLTPLLCEEIVAKIDLFKDERNHTALRVHKLKGRLKDCYAFFVNYQFRVVFQFVGRPKRAYLLAVGDHDVYDR